MIIDQAELRELLRELRTKLDEAERAASVAPTADGGVHLPAVAKRLLDERRQRDACFPPGTFGEPAWDLLLALYVAREERRQLCAMDSYKAAGVGHATGGRLLARMERIGLVERRPDPDSRKNVLVNLTPEGADRLSSYLAGLL